MRDIEYKVYAIKRISTDVVVYVGITKNSLERRFSSHMRDKRRNPKKVNYFNCHKKDLCIKLLEGGIDSLEKANDREVYYISYYKNKHGRLLNATDGGDGTKGFAPWNKGVACEYVDKLMDNSPRAKKIFAYTDSGDYICEYNSIKKAHEATGVARAAIQRIAEGRKRYKTANGYTFRFYRKDKVKVEKMSDKDRVEIVRQARNDMARQVVVYHKESGKYIRYKNARDCSKYLPLKLSSIVAYCSQKKETQKYTFSYV